MNRYGYERHSTVDVDTVIREVVRYRKHWNKRITINGIAVGITSLRLRTFAEHGIICCGCGIEAQFFAIERHPRVTPNPKDWHVNLYGYNEQGEELLFTHDHRLARSLGGTDALENTDTMCARCNNKKGTHEHKLLMAQRRKLQQELESNG